MVSDKVTGKSWLALHECDVRVLENATKVQRVMVSPFFPGLHAM